MSGTHSVDRDAEGAAAAHVAAVVIAAEPHLQAAAARVVGQPAHPLACGVIVPEAIDDQDQSGNSDCFIRTWVASWAWVGLHCTTYRSAAAAANGQGSRW